MKQYLPIIIIILLVISVEMQSKPVLTAINRTTGERLVIRDNLPLDIVYKNSGFVNLQHVKYKIIQDNKLYFSGNLCYPKDLIKVSFISSKRALWGFVVKVTGWFLFFGMFISAILNITENERGSKSKILNSVFLLLASIMLLAVTLYAFETINSPDYILHVEKWYFVIEQI